MECSVQTFLVDHEKSHPCNICRIIVSGGEVEGRVREGRRKIRSRRRRRRMEEGEEEEEWEEKAEEEVEEEQQQKMQQ